MFLSEKEKLKNEIDKLYEKINDFKQENKFYKNNLNEEALKA